MKNRVVMRVDLTGLRLAMGLPDDVEILNIRPIDSPCMWDDYHLLLESDSFPETPKGQKWPIVDAVFTDDGFKEFQYET